MRKPWQFLFGLSLVFASIAGEKVNAQMTPVYNPGGYGAVSYPPANQQPMQGQPTSQPYAGPGYNAQPNTQFGPQQQPQQPFYPQGGMGQPGYNAPQVPPQNYTQVAAQPQGQQQPQQRQAAQEAQAGNAYYVSDPEFQLPVQNVDPQAIEVQLFVSKDGGRSWQLAKRQDPREQVLPYLAQQNGEHWFAVHVIKPDNANMGAPQQFANFLRVIVDTEKPILDFRANGVENGTIRAEWQVTDASADARGLKVEYRPAGQQHANSPWLNAARPENSERTGSGLKGAVEFVPQVNQVDIDVRLTVRDRAENESVVLRQVRMPLLANRNPNAVANNGAFQPAAHSNTQTNPAAQQNNPSIPWNASGGTFNPSAPAPTSPLPNSGVAATPVSTGANSNSPAPNTANGASSATAPRIAQLPNGGSAGNTTITSIPNPTFSNVADSTLPNKDYSYIPTPEVPGRVNSITGAPLESTSNDSTATEQGTRDLGADSRSDAGGSTNKLPLPFQPQRQPLPNLTPPAEESALRSNLSDSSRNGQVEELPGVEELPAPHSGSAVKTGSNASSSSGLPIGEMARLTSTRRFRLAYEVDSLGANGVVKVDLWMTEDAGTTWQKWGDDPDCRSPISVEELPGEGVYGFRLVITSVNGLAGAAPEPGDLADIWVEVDEAKPQGRIISAPFGEGADEGKLLIKWESQDRNLAPRPVTLYYASEASGPWNVIAAGQAEVGTYAWTIVPSLPRRVYLKMQCRDQAGNIVEDQTPRPIDLSQLSPRATIKGFEPVND